MRFINRSLVFCSLSLFFVGGLAFADQKLGFVDYDKAIKEEKEALNYFKDLELQEVALATWEQDAKNKFEKKMSTYKEQMPKWKEEKRKTEEGKLSAEISELQQESAKRRQELNTNQQAKLEELKTKNLRLVEELAKKQGYAMIFNAATLVYVSDEMKKKNDITADLVKLYNEKYKVVVPPPAPAAPSTKTLPEVKPTPAKKILKTDNASTRTGAFAWRAPFGR